MDETRIKFNEGVKNFGDNHPKIQNAATKTKGALGKAKTFTSNALNKLIESNAVKNLTQGINNKYKDIMESETVNNISKKAEEGYISLKLKAGMKLSNDNINNINSVPADDNKGINDEQKEPLVNNVEEQKVSKDNSEEQKEIKDNIEQKEVKDNPEEQQENHYIF